MKTRLALVTLLIILACAAASAQSYHIRVTSPVRLRASYSLRSPIVERTQAGDVLQVVGRFNRWLKIDRNGVTAWLADWVNYTRLDQAETALNAATGAQTPIDIDNCCFVNRKCMMNQEWVAGYHAYQRNECPVSQPAAQVSAPVSAPAGQPINNCCFVNRQCASDEEWVAG